MSDAGSIFSDINPNTTSGTQLATLLNDFKDIVISGFCTTTGSRPANMLDGGFWVDAQADPIRVLKHYDGTDDITVFTIDTTTNSIILASAASPFEINKVSDDAIGPIVNLLKKRIAGGGQTVDGDTVGEVNFTGTTSTGTPEIMAQLLVEASDNVTPTVHGSKMTLLTTPDGGSALTARLAVDEFGKIGIGESSPESKVHVSGNSAASDIKNEQKEDSVVGPKNILKKSRIASSGQVLDADVIGDHDFVAKDETGAERVLARIRVIASENVVSTQHGADFSMSVVKPGETALTEFINITDGNLILNGQQETDVKTSTALLAPDTTRDLVDIDGDVFPRFTIDLGVYGRDNTIEYRKQKTIIEAIYNPITTSWTYFENTEMLTDTNELITFAYTNGQTLNIDYDNQFVLANYVDGFIFMEVKKYLKV